MYISVARLAIAALLLCSWGLIATTSGSVDGTIGYIDIGDDGFSPDEPVQEEETVEQKITANLMVNDMEETIAFYRDVLGFNIEMNVPENPPYDWVMMQRDGAAIMFASRESIGADLDMFRGMATGGSFLLWIIVDDVKKIEAAVQGKAEIVKGLTKQFYGMLELTIKDPDGYVLVFAQRIEE